MKIFIRLSVMAMLLANALPVFAHSLPEPFQSTEHVIAGRAVKIQLKPGVPLSSDYLLHLPNGLLVSYGDITMLAGDFYGIPEDDISGAGTPVEEEVRFVRSFDTLARDPNAVIEMPQILAIARDQEKEIEAGRQQGLGSEEIWHRLGDRYDRKWNCLTGGGCGVGWWLTPGRYLRLAEADYDHFGADALRAYSAGHRVALRMAVNAKKTGDTHQLELAHAMNAWACHYLADHFAAGHLRIPRREMNGLVTPSLLGSALVPYMHTEENRNGLHVHNSRGDRWYAMGDNFYLDEKNRENQEQERRALQLSADEVFAAYQTGVEASGHAVTELVPEADETGFGGKTDIAPMFWLDASGRLQRRQHLQDLYDREGTTDWWGWSTLSILVAERGMPTVARTALAQGNLRIEAKSYGISGF